MREEMARKISSPEDLFAEIKDGIPTSHHNPSAFWPNRLAAALSHVTVSRHGDIVLRGMNVPDDKPVDRAVVAPWTRNASGFLVAQFVALVLVTALVLHLQTRGRRTFVRMKTVAQTVRPLRVES